MKHRGGTIWFLLVLATASPCLAAGNDAADAMRRAVTYLLSLQTPEGSWATPYTVGNPGGVESLVVLAALTGGTPADDPKIQKALKVITAADSLRTYPRAVRTMLYARLGRGYEAKLEAEVAWLVKTQLPTGGWGYGPGHPQTPGNPKWTDQCNTAMALLALAKADEAGKAAPLDTWKRAGKYLQDVQQSDGGWAYSSFVRTSSFGSMTAGGVAALVDVADRLPLKDRPVPTATAANGLTWLAKNFEVAKIPKWGWLDTEYWPYFYLMFLARSGEAAGWVVNDVDWRDAIAKQLLKSQTKQGSWTHESKTEDKAQVIRTSFAVLALAQATAPAVVEELILPGQPVLGNHTGALLAGVAGRRLGRGVTWLRAGAGAPRTPLLYLQANVGTTLDKDLCDRLRAHVAAGGTILVQPAPGDAGLAKQIVAALQAATADLGFETADLADDHPLYTAARTVKGDDRPKFVGIGDVLRTSILIARGDFRSLLAANDPAAGDVAENLMLLAVGDDPAGWRAASRAGGRHATAVATIRVARVAHAGGAGACPDALTQLSYVLQDAVSTSVSSGEGLLSLKQPVPAGVQLLWITGSKDPQLGEGEWKNLADYARHGGMVFMDSTIGREAFTQAALTNLRKLFPDQVVRLDEKADLLTGQFGGGIGAEILPVKLSRGAQRDNRKFELYGVRINGRLGVVLSPLGVTSAMESDRIFGAATLASDDALRLGANVALYALTPHP
ncbi:MAG: DUF4159 domain-containing protein [Planctomycetota bacterium]|nr:DUF4159 domain-containing protein [Planctomycetota bacterium]